MTKIWLYEATKEEIKQIKRVEKIVREAMEVARKEKDKKGRKMLASMVAHEIVLGK